MVDLCSFRNSEGLKLLGRLASVHVYGTANQQSSLSCDILKELFKKPNFSTGGNTMKHLLSVQSRKLVLAYGVMNEDDADLWDVSDEYQFTKFTLL